MVNIPSIYGDLGMIYITYWFTHINPQDRTVGNLVTFKYHWTNLRETRFVIVLGMASNPQKMQKTICLTILE